MWRSLAGLVAAIAVSAAVIAIAFGASNYIQWTVRYATARRLPPVSQLLSIYNDSDLWWWIAVCLVAILFRHARWLILAAVALLGVAHSALLPPFEEYDSIQYWSGIQQVADTSFGGGVMPQKSTDFYPKLLSGLTIYQLG